MKLAIISGGAALLMLLLGITWLAVMDVPVKQAPVSKIIPNERFFNGQ